MKKAFYSITLLLTACLLSVTSCKKVYHCNCTFNNQVVYTQDLGLQVLKTAKSECSSHDSTITGEAWTCTVN
jgi:hypothetical protein